MQSIYEIKICLKYDQHVFDQSIKRRKNMRRQYEPWSSIFKNFFLLVNKFSTATII